MYFNISLQTVENINKLKQRFISHFSANQDASVEFERRFEELSDQLGVFTEPLTQLYQAIKKINNANYEAIDSMQKRLSMLANLVEIAFNRTMLDDIPVGALLSFDSRYGIPTQYKSTKEPWNLDNDKNYIYDSPLETAQNLDIMQGKDTNFQGTCGLVSCVNILRMAGLEIGEQDIVAFAANNFDEQNGCFKPLCEINGLPEENGGTGPNDRVEILKHFGIESELCKQNVDDIAKYVESGKGVIISVNPSILYKEPYITDERHAITVLSVKRDLHNKLLGFYVCDSNSAYLNKPAATFYSTDELNQALRKDRPCNVTINAIR